MNLVQVGGYSRVKDKHSISCMSVPILFCSCSHCIPFLFLSSNIPWSTELQYNYNQTTYEHGTTKTDYKFRLVISQRHTVK